MFWRELPPSYEENCKAKGLILYQCVTFASLIELETKFDDERSMISEVIWRRLKAREPLGIDAALIYGIPNYDGDIKWVHLRDRKNKYNTRIFAGLPPSPIGSPSRDSLAAVLTPTNFGYRYYVLDIQIGERHHFSKSPSEHQKICRSPCEANGSARCYQIILVLLLLGYECKEADVSKKTAPKKKTGDEPVKSKSRGGGIENRKSQRIPIQLLVDYRSDGHYLFDFCRDLGTGGVFIQTSDPLPHGSTVDLTFTIPDSKETLETKGTVIWVQPQIRGRDELTAGMGVQFSEFDGHHA